MDPKALQQHRWRNTLHTLAMLGGMGGLLGLIGYVMSGWGGVVWLSVLWLATVLFAPRVSPRWALRMNGASPIQPHEARTLYRTVQELTERANLPVAPQLYYLPSHAPNAITLGNMQRPYIAVSEGLLQMLSTRELRGVLAHEIAHIKNNDLKLMTMADSMSRVTSLISMFGQLLLLIQFPLLLFGQKTIPWLLLLLLIVAPMASRLLGLALSRVREFEADREAVRLTEDPVGLANALQRVERSQFSLWQIFWPISQSRTASLFRTHPASEERIERLMALKSRYRQRPQRIMRPSNEEPVLTLEFDPWSGTWSKNSQYYHRRVYYF